MEVDLKEKKIFLRCTEVAGTINCQLALPLKWKMLLEQGEPEPSEAQALGSHTHECIYNILTKPQHERVPMSGQVAKILKQPAEFIHLDLNRSQFYIDAFELLYKMKCVVICQNVKHEIALPIDVIGAHQIPKAIHEQGKSHNYNFETVWDNNKLKFLSNTRGPDSRLEVHGLSYVMPVDGTTIEEGLSTYTSLFGKPLAFLEQKYEFDFMLDGWKINFSGTLDATPSTGNPIVDWKTTKITPQDKASGRYANYYIQPANYRNLFCKNNGIPTSECYMILAFLVKTKRPKFKPVCFKLTKDMIKYSDFLVKQAARVIIRYVEKGTLPAPSVSTERCSYCNVRQYCAQVNPIFPNVVDIIHILQNET